VTGEERMNREVEERGGRGGGVRRQREEQWRNIGSYGACRRCFFGILGGEEGRRRCTHHFGIKKLC
jgi:hypothetical protein